MGTPEFAVPSLRSVISAFDVVAVITQPDRKAGRGRKTTQSAVKVEARDNGLEIIQPENLSSPEVLRQLEELKPELIVVAAYGKILKSSALELPDHGSINVHASLLPRWRGASPIQSSILHGDKVSGVTIMKMDEGMDTGPLLAQAKLLIPEEATGGELSEMLADLAASLLVRTIQEYVAGEIIPQPQDDKNSSYTSLLKKRDGQLDFDQTAEYLARQVRAYLPWPGSYFYLGGKRFSVNKVEAATSKRGNPGETGRQNSSPTIGTSEGALVLLEIQPSGKNNMTGEQFLRGNARFLNSAIDPWNNN